MDDLMHASLERYLKSRGADKATLQGWNMLWRRARTEAVAPFPCPECYHLGRQAPLLMLPREENRARAHCKACGKAFTWPV